MATGCLDESETQDLADEGNSVATDDQARTITYEKFLESVTIDPTTGTYLIEGDIAVDDEEAVRTYYEKTFGNAEGLTVNTINGTDDVWSATQRWNLSYCVSTADFGNNKAMVVRAMQQAAAAWENVADVRFVHNTAQDGSCTNANGNVIFDVRLSPPNPPYSARSFFPSTSRTDRELLINWGSGWNERTLMTVLIHELGHSLGFRHEHIRAPGTTCTENGTSRGVTDYDNLSVMHYTSCPGAANNTGYYFLSQRDIQGAQSLYGAPSNVLNASDGTLYARKRTTGDIYKKSGGSWVKIGSPGQTFVTVGNTLYGQSSANGGIWRYSGSGTTWTNVGGAAGIMINCGGYLCATNPTSNDIYRYDGSSWSFIGSPGAIFAASTSSLFGATSLQQSLYRYSGSGSSWTLAGDATADLIGGGTSMYRLNIDRSAVQRYSSGTTWTTVGGAGRQWLATSGDLYGLTPDTGAIYKYSGSGTAWTAVGGAAARMYGSYGRLYATNPSSGNIFRYDAASNTWTGEGQP
jgi:hypothetical protein